MSSASALLRLALVWAVCRCARCNSGCARRNSGVARLSDPSLVERLSQAGDWLCHLVGAVLAARVGGVPTVAGRRLRIVDATTVCRPGADRTTWRLHVGNDLSKGQVAALTLSDLHGGERLNRFTPQAGELVLADAGYATPKDLRATAAADVIVRLGWNSLRLLTPEGTPFDLFATLRARPAPQAARRPASCCCCPACPARRSAPATFWRCIVSAGTSNCCSNAGNLCSI